MESYLKGKRGGGNGRNLLESPAGSLPPPELSDQWEEEKLVLGLIVPWRAKGNKRTWVVSVTHLRLQPQCTALMRWFLEDWRNSGGRAADGWSKSAWPDWSKAFKSVKGPSGDTLSHMERPFGKRQALRTTLKAMFPLLKSRCDVYCNNNKQIHLMTCYLFIHNQWNAERSRVTAACCFLIRCSLVHQMQVLAQIKHAGQAMHKPGVPVVHWSDTSASLGMRVFGSLYLWGILYTGRDTIL